MPSTYTWAFELRDETRVALRHGLDGHTAAEPSSREPLDDAEWSGLLAEAAHHRLNGLLVAAVASGELPATPEQRAEMARLEVELTSARMWQEVRFVEVIKELRSAGIETCVLKGPALAALDYPDRQWRPTSDLDLLVPGEQLDAARRVLDGDGAVQRDLDPTPGYGATIGKGGGVTLADGLEVDLHRVLVAGSFGVRIRADDLWQGRRTFTFGGAECTTLSLDASLLHACYHLLIFGYPRALTLRDVAQPLLDPELDPDRTLWLARRWHAEILLAAGIQMARHELELDATSILLDWADGYVPRVRDRMWLRIERSGEHLSPFMALGEYLALPTPADRVTFRRAVLHPAPDTWPRLETRVWRMTQRLARNASRQVADRVPFGRR